MFNHNSSSFPPPQHSAKLARKIKAIDVSMPVIRTSAKPEAGEEASPYKPHANLRKAKVTLNTTEDVDDFITDNNHASTSRAATNRGLRRPKVQREVCTEEQTAALENFYNLHEGRPTKKQKEEFAAKIGKTYYSTDVWIRNRRSKKPKATPRRQTLVHVSDDPVADKNPLNDTKMIELTTPEHPEQPIQTLAAPIPRPRQAKKPRGRATRLLNAQAAISRPTRAKTARATAPSVMPTRPSSPSINNFLTNEPLILDDHHASGDSNGSVSQPPEATPPAAASHTVVVTTWVPTQPEHRLEEYPLDEQEAARVMTGMHVIAKNHRIVAGKILSDSPDAYEPWAFPLPSASNRRVTRSKSQKGDIGQWRREGGKEAYYVNFHMVPQSWMAGPSRNSGINHP